MTPAPHPISEDDDAAVLPVELAPHNSLVIGNADVAGRTSRRHWPATWPQLAKLSPTTLRSISG